MRGEARVEDLSLGLMENPTALSSQGSPGSSTSIAHGQDREPERSSVEILEHNHNKTSRELSSSNPSKSLARFPMEYQLCRDPENPVGDPSNGSLYNPSDNETLPPVSNKSVIHMWIVPLSALIPAVSLVIWVVDASQKDRIFTSLAGRKLGGHLTQTQAKGIDFVCSALMAPLLFAGLNVLWFACARVCVINESARSVPLQTLATVSALSRGTYDPLQYYTLLRGRTWRLATLGGIALFSALGGTALGNMVAYEVFNEDRPSSKDFSLRLLRDAIIGRTMTHSEFTTTMDLYDFGTSDFTTTAKSVSELLYGFEFLSATLDEDGGYIGVNSTSASMENLDTTVNTLSNVPGFRLSAECLPGNMTSVQVWPAKDGYVDISPNITYHRDVAAGGSSQERDWGSATYTYFSGQEDGTTSVASNWAFPAWGCGETGCGEEFYIIYMMSGIHPQALHTDYGDLQPAHQYKGDHDDYGADFQVSPATSWSLKCVLFQQQGLMNYTRSSDLKWSMNASSFDGTKTAIDSQLSNWQRVKLNGDWTPPQLGAVLFGRDPLKPCRTGDDQCLPSRNVSNSVGNYIYASGEILRIVHNVAATNASRAAGHPEYYHNVTGTVNKQYYRITYVPVLLLVALVSIVLAALLTTALMISVRGTVSWSWFRQVDVVRLVVDAVGGSLKHQDEHQFAKLGGTSDDEILSWAQEYRVAYVKVPKDQSQESEDFDQVQPSSVQLVHKTSPSVREWTKARGIDEL